MGRKLKVAIFGNMNNNNFSIMRYLRDLGTDAHLFLFKEDGEGASSHFDPLNDTWQLEKWKPYIHQLNLSCRWAAFFPDVGINSFSLPAGNSGTKKELKRKGVYEFDKYIGSGLSPAVLAKGGIKLDIFYPYSNGIEYVGHVLTQKELEKKFSIKKLIYLYLKKKQVEGIKNARFCLNAEMGLTKETFEQIGKSFLPLAIPMVYNRQKADQIPEPLKRVGHIMAKQDLSIFSHASHKWVKKDFYSEKEWEKTNKRNDILIRGFATFLKDRLADFNAKLFFVEYGHDVQASKDLCKKLKIEDAVIWLPQMSRKEIMYLLEKTDFGVGEFYKKYGTIWGGTGWEVMASGKPLLQSFNFTEPDYLKKFGHTSPPICDVKKTEDIVHHLTGFKNNKLKYERIGKKSKEWFEKYNGIGLAKKWLDLLT